MCNEDKAEVVYESSSDSFSKSNTLISSKYKSTLFEQKILNIVLAKLQDKDYANVFKNNHNDLICEIKASELKHIMNASHGRFYNQLKTTAAKMTTKSIGFIDDESKTFKYVSLISYAEYKDGVFRVKFNNELEKYLSPKTQFTVLSLPIILQYKSLYSLRLHELLLSRCYTKKRTGIYKYHGQETDGKHFVIELDLNELKLCMGVVNAEASIVQEALSGSEKPNYEKAVEKSNEKTFSRWVDFRHKVIETGVNEINEVNKFIHVDFEPMKGGKGGKVYGVRFFVDLLEDQPEEIEVIEEKSEELDEEERMTILFQAKSLIKENISFKDTTAICEAANYNFDKINKAYTIASASSNISNFVGFMIKAIKEGYSEPVTKTKKNSFNNFNQREYDYDEVERLWLRADERERESLTEN